jgi:cytochrome c553
MHTTRIFLLFLGALLALPAIAKGDPAKGRQLVAEAKCEICHDNKVMGAPGAIYQRKDRKVTDYAKLKSQVSLCTTQLNLALFPEDEEDIAAWLNQAWYRFSEPK